MVRDDVINTYFGNLKMYRHLLSPQERIDDHKKFAEYIRKTCCNEIRKKKQNT